MDEYELKGESLHSENGFSLLRRRDFIKLAGGGAAGCFIFSGSGRPAI
jgi:hypothetical protein